MIISDKPERIKTPPTTLASPQLTELVEAANHHHRQLKDLLAKSLDHARAAGDALLQIKSSLPHGQFQKWIDANCEFTDRTARRYMLIAEGWERIEAKRTHVRNLSLREAVKLLSEDEENSKPFSIFDLDADDWGHTPEDWEPTRGTNRVRDGVLPDGRMIVLLTHSTDERYIRTAIIDVDHGFSDYDKRGVIRHYLRYVLGLRGVDPATVLWSDPDDCDPRVIEAAFGEVA